MDSLSSRLNSIKAGCYVGNTLLNHIIYADDLTVIATSIVGLRKLLAVCDDYASEFDIIFNASKSQAIFFHKCKVLLNPGSLQIGGNKIPWSTSVKYLGITLNNSLNDAAEMNIQLRNFYSRSNGVLRNFYKCSTRVKLVLFQAYCSNFYLSYLWFLFPLYSFKRCCVGI